MYVVALGEQQPARARQDQRGVVAFCCKWFDEGALVEAVDFEDLAVVQVMESALKDLKEEEMAVVEGNAPENTLEKALEGREGPEQ